MKKALFLFLLLPLVIFWFTGISAINHRQKIIWAETELRLNRQVEEIINFLEPTSFMQKLFDDFTDELLKQDITPERLKLLTAKYSSKKMKFEPCVFVNGQLLNSNELELDELPVSKIWEYMHDREGDTKELFFHIKTKVRSRLGPMFSIPRMKNTPRTAMEFTGKSGNGLIYYLPQDRKNGALIIAWHLPGPQTIAKHLPNELKRNLKLTITSKRNLAHEKEAQPEEVTQPIVSKIFNGCEIKARGNFSELDHDRGKTLVLILLVFFSGLLIGAFRHAVVNDSPANAPIRLKLVALSLYAVIFPLMGFVYFGWKMTTERRALLRQEATNACLESINEVDAGFERELERILRFYRTLILQFEEKTNHQDIFDYFEELKKLEEANWVEFRDLDANPVVTTQDPRTAEQIGIIGKAFARHGITNYLAHKLPPQHKLTPSASEILIQEFLESPFGGWARVFESPDELSLLSFGGRDLLWYWNVYPDHLDNAAFMACDTYLHWAIQSYLKEVLVRRIAHKQTALRLLAWSKQSTKTFPGNEKFVGDLAGFIHQIRRNSQPQTTELEWEGHKWLIAGAPGKRLKDHVILALYPAEEIERQLERLQKDITWAAIFAIFLAILTGRLFSFTLIEPISQLMIGVNAIRNRDVTKKVALVQNDELGKLSQSFNQTIETLADVICAQKIQELLISDEIPEIEGWQGAITYLPASDLGGDYCDVQKIDENNWLFAIGDVTGRGVSSALVTAMTKAIVSEYVNNGMPDLHELFVCLNEMLFQQFNRRKCMTMFIMQVNTATGQCKGINAGHPSPIKLTGNEAITIYHDNSSPLGLNNQKADLSEIEFKLQPNDVLFMHTNFLGKAASHTNQPLVCEALQSFCLQHLHESTEFMSNSIVSEINRLNKEGLEDDLTLLILRRNSC